MIPPAAAAGRLAACTMLGLALGLVYGFLRPLGQRHRHLSDLLFLLAAGAAWIFAGFGICRGDLRPGYLAGLALGALLWELTVGRLLRPVFSGIWKAFFLILGWPARILRKIFRKIRNFLKNVFASGKKSGTIDKIKRPVVRLRRKGARHDKRKRHTQPDPDRIQAQQQRNQDRGALRYRTVYGDTSDPGQRDP